MKKIDLHYDYLISFDKVTVGVESKQIFNHIINAQIDQCSIEKLFCTNDIENPFSVKKKSLDKKVELLIKFYPKTPNQKYVSHYCIKYGNNKSILRITGYSEALRVLISVQNLTFFRFKNNKKIKSVFEIQNNSNACVYFQFDIDNNQNIYNVDPIYGKIEPKKHFSVHIKFVTEIIGLFLLELPCLFLYHAPLFIRLFGVNSSVKTISDLVTLKALSSVVVQSGYEKYMTNYYGCPHFENACSLTKINFDFNVINRRSFSTEVTNYTRQCIKIVWDTDNTTNFSIDPEIKYLRPNEKSSIYLKFTPTIKDYLYGAQLYGKALMYETSSENENDLEVELNFITVPIALRLIGNSFAGRNTWNPNIEMTPEVIYMPICRKNDTVYSTFMIKRLGLFPVTFKFIPPELTNFTVNPLLGLITGDYQIVVVQFCAKSSSNSTYNEYWDIEFNNRKESTLSITMRALTENPQVIIGSDNTVNFGVLFPGCKKTISVPIVNITQNSVRIKFLSNKWVHIENDDGIIDCYDTVSYKWSYIADCDIPTNLQLKYELYNIHGSSLITGAASTGVVNIIAGCSFAKLCSSPISHDFGKIICGEKYKTTFNIFNFSDCEINFILKSYEHFGCSEKEPFHIEPSKGTLYPKESLKIEVSLLAYCSCISTYCIRYHIREDDELDEFVEQKSQMYKTSAILFRMDYYSFYPTLKFVDIGKNSTGPLFGKINIWEFFEIDRINAILKTIEANETQRVNIRVPEAQLGYGLGKEIIFILKNITDVDTTCNFTRKKICDCALKQTEGTATFRKFNYDNCPHRKILQINAPDKIIKANSVAYITINILYKLEQRQEMCYIMNLSNNRSIELYFNITTLFPAQLSTYKCGFNFNMPNVYIGELDPHIQLYWIANNTHEISSYEININPLIELNERMGFEILTCLNPKSNVEPKTSFPIKFLFAPISTGFLQINLPFMFGSDMQTLIITGEGTITYKSPPTYNFSFTKDYYSYPNLLVHISTENIVIKYLPTHCKVTRIFTLRNVSKTNKVGFWIESDYIENIMSVSVNPSKGVLQPRSMLTLVLTVSSYGSPCNLRAICPVHFIDQTKLTDHIRSKTSYFQAAAASHDFFCITDNKTEYAQPLVEITTSPKIFHRNIAITCNIVDIPDIDIKIPIQDQLKQQPFEEVLIYKHETLKLFLNKKRTSPSDSEKSAKFDDISEKIIKITDKESDIISKTATVKYELKEGFNDTYNDRSSIKNFNKIVSGSSKKDVKHRCKPKICCTPLTDKNFEVVHTVLGTLIRHIVYSEKFKHHIKYGMKNECHLYYAEFQQDNMKPEKEKSLTELLLNRIPDSMLSETLQTLIGDALLQQFQLGPYPNVTDECDNQSKILEKSYSIGKELYAENFQFLLN